jgi:hypothetical protein
MEKKYMNQYEVKENHVLLHIFGLKYEATVILEKDDYEAVSRVNWGVMSVGREGNKKLIPYTVINRTSIPLGRWLLNVHQAGMRVEHHDRNNHNFLRSNVYVTGKRDYKQQLSISQEGSVCGVFEVKQKDGKSTGYKVQYVDAETNTKKWMCFSAKKCNGLENARKQAIQFRLSLVQKSSKELAS